MLALLALTVVQQSPVAMLDAVRAHYRSLYSFSMTIENHDASGLFPGDFTQTLRFRKGNRFELRVTKANPKDVSKPGTKAPDYYCDGTIVWTKWPGQLLSEHSALNRNPNNIPGYEVSSGMILSWLLNSPSADFFLRPPAGMKIDFTFGKAVTWRQLDVRPVVLTMEQSKDVVAATFYCSRQGDHLVGLEWTNNGKVGYAKYLNQVENPKLPATLGDFRR